MILSLISTCSCEVAATFSNEYSCLSSGPRYDEDEDGGVAALSQETKQPADIEDRMEGK